MQQIKLMGCNFSISNVPQFVRAVDEKVCPIYAVWVNCQGLVSCDVIIRNLVMCCHNFFSFQM